MSDSNVCGCIKYCAQLKLVYLKSFTQFIKAVIQQRSKLTLHSKGCWWNVETLLLNMKPIFCTAQCYKVIWRYIDLTLGKTLFYSFSAIFSQCHRCPVAVFKPSKLGSWTDWAANWASEKKHFSKISHTNVSLFFKDIRQKVNRFSEVDGWSETSQPEDLTIQKLEIWCKELSIYLFYFVTDKDQNKLKRWCLASLSICVEG